ncbi:unnamed protein product [Paramecium sonneborni]|nr:unnamed protein product [Paramecium sonneborni]
MLHEIVLEKDYGILRENNLKWYINGEQIYNIDNIYSNTNLQMDVKQSQQFQSLFIYLTGNFKEKIRINLYSPNLYYYDEYLPLDTLKDKDALANYLILKIFGPNLVEKDISVLDISYGGSEIYIEYNFKCNN